MLIPTKSDSVVYSEISFKVVCRRHVLHLLFFVTQSLQGAAHCHGWRHQLQLSGPLCFETLSFTILRQAPFFCVFFVFEFVTAHRALCCRSRVYLLILLMPTFEFLQPSFGRRGGARPRFFAQACARRSQFSFI